MFASWRALRCVVLGRWKNRRRRSCKSLLNLHVVHLASLDRSFQVLRVPGEHEFLGFWCVFFRYQKLFRLDWSYSRWCSYISGGLLTVCEAWRMFTQPQKLPAFWSCWPKVFSTMPSSHAVCLLAETGRKRHSNILIRRVQISSK